MLCEWPHELSLFLFLICCLLCWVLFTGECKKLADGVVYADFGLSLIPCLLWWVLPREPSWRPSCWWRGLPRWASRIRSEGKHSACGQFSRRTPGTVCRSMHVQKQTWANRPLPCLTSLETKSQRWIGVGFIVVLRNKLHPGLPSRVRAWERMDDGFVAIRPLQDPASSLLLTLLICNMKVIGPDLEISYTGKL